MRLALNSTLREQVLTDKNLHTLMWDIECLINDRPITKLSDTCNDLEALMPNHLLLLKRIPCLPQVFVKTDNYVRKQYLANLFRQRQLKENLPLLHEVIDSEKFIANGKSSTNITR